MKKLQRYLLLVMTICTTQLTFAWWPLPTKRDLVVTSAATIGTLALVRNYYLGQEQRIIAAMSRENEALQATLIDQEEETRAALQAQGRETRTLMRNGGQEILAAVTQGTATLSHQIEDQGATLSNQNGVVAQMLQSLLAGQNLVLESNRRIERNIGISPNTPVRLLEGPREASPQFRSQGTQTTNFESPLGQLAHTIPSDSMYITIPQLVRAPAQPSYQVYAEAERESSINPIHSADGIVTVSYTERFKNTASSVCNFVGKLFY